MQCLLIIVQNWQRSAVSQLIKGKSKWKYNHLQTEEVRNTCIPCNICVWNGRKLYKAKIEYHSPSLTSTVSPSRSLAILDCTSKKLPFPKLCLRCCFFIYSLLLYNFSEIVKYLSFTVATCHTHLPHTRTHTRACTLLQILS